MYINKNDNVIPIRMMVDFKKKFLKYNLESDDTDTLSIFQYHTHYLFKNY